MAAGSPRISGPTAGDCPVLGMFLDDPLDVPAEVAGLRRGIGLRKMLLTSLEGRP
jgi:hypothetical protein